MTWTEAEIVAQVETLTPGRLRLWLRQGWVVPADERAGAPVFDAADLARLRLVCALKDEMEINDAGIPVVLSLIDQLHGLRREMRTLARLLDAQPEAVRRALRQAVRERA